MSENKTVVVPVDKELQLAKVEAAAHEATIGHLSQRVDEAVALAEEAVELMTRFHSHAQPDNTPDMNAVFPAMHFRNFVDDHARLMFKLNQFQRNPVEPSFLRLKKAADLVCAVMGAHGEISARDDRVQALMNCLYETDPLKSVYAEEALSAAPAATAQPGEREALSDEQIRFRFFKNLTADQRLAVFKAFGVYPDDCTESLNHGIETRLLAAILKRRAALTAAKPGAVNET